MKNGNPSGYKIISGKSRRFGLRRDITIELLPNGIQVNIYKKWLFLLATIPVSTPLNFGEYNFQVSPGLIGSWPVLFSYLIPRFIKRYSRSVVKLMSHFIELKSAPKESGTSKNIQNRFLNIYSLSDQEVEILKNYRASFIAQSAPFAVTQLDSCDNSNVILPAAPAQMAALTKSHHIAQDIIPVHSIPDAISPVALNPTNSLPGWTEPHKYYLHEFLSHSEFILFAKRLREAGHQRQLDRRQPDKEWIQWSNQTFAKLLQLARDNPKLFDEPESKSSVPTLVAAGVFPSVAQLEDRLSWVPKDTQTAWKEFCSSIRNPLLQAYAIIKVIAGNGLEKCEKNSPLKALDELGKVLSGPFFLNGPHDTLLDIPELIIRKMFLGEEKWAAFFETKEFKERGQPVFANKIGKIINQYWNTKCNTVESKELFVDAVAEWIVRGWDNSRYSPIVFAPYNFMFYQDFMRNSDRTCCPFPERHRNTLWRASTKILAGKSDWSVWAEQLVKAVDKYEERYTDNPLEFATHSLKRVTLRMAALSPIYPREFEFFVWKDSFRPVGQRCVSYCYSRGEYGTSWALGEPEQDIALKLLGDVPRDLPWILRSLK